MVLVPIATIMILLRQTKFLTLSEKRQVCEDDWAHDKLDPPTHTPHATPYPAPPERHLGCGTTTMKRIIEIP